MKTINIKGKEYIPVVERIKEFHKLYKGNIVTEIIGTGENRVVVKATVTITEFVKKDEEIILDIPMVFTGHSQAEWGKGMMGNVALEVAETSAVGRALGFAGIGIDAGIASADEIRKVGKVEDDNEVPF